MNIVLLSGGSGKRLWPLSNDIRSKQFIKMLKNETNQVESMIQRIYRQIKTVMPEANITIATCQKQVAIIRNQLGKNVDVSVEPERKDTFPGIVLAVSYLYDVKKVSSDDVVMICPVDSYVNLSYFEKMKEMYYLTKMEKERQGTNLTLMGIEPTYPSEKYGYIIPQENTNISFVKTFKEKPNMTEAKKYIDMGALWNSGVFAFKIGYLLEKAHNILNFIDYFDLYNNYSKCMKISFDYAVVEKEFSILVLRYCGSWKDIGTWNTLSEEMSEPTIGKATLDETCVNVNVINEIDIPILCMGLKNQIVVAAGDGVLVADKGRSSFIKSYVDRFHEQIRFVEKSWGKFYVLDVQSNSLTIKIILTPGHRLHYHSHDKRDEVWTIIKGSGRTVIDGMEQEVQSGNVFIMKAGCKHTIIAETELHVLEIQLGKEISVEDKHRYNL